MLSFVLLPISGFWLCGYLTLVVILSTWVSFLVLQNFLQLNKPLQLFKPKSKATKVYDPALTDQCVKQISGYIDEFYIRSWFSAISQEASFSDESSAILEDVIKKLINIRLVVDNESIIHGVLNVYLKHLKEFRRGLKRKTSGKYSGKISELYRYSHAYSSSRKERDYFIHKLTNTLLNHFISWELINSLPYQVVVSIISRRVVTYILALLSNPEFLNFYIINYIASPTKKKDLNLEKYSRIKILKVTENEQVPDSINTQNKPVRDSPNQEENHVGKVVNEDILEKPSLRSILSIPIKEPEVIEQMSEDVKIYEAKSCKTWYDSYDLDSVTIGQDILDIMNASEEMKENEDHDKSDGASPITAAKNLLDEVKNITSLEGLKTSMKPISEVTLHNIKDLQESTVNNVVKPVSQVTSTALHKIGGLHLQDEAAGMVEGIWDFGRTKIRKGLRLTGIQDEEEAHKILQKKNIKIPRVISQEKIEDSETTWINPLQEEIKPNQKLPLITTQVDDEASPDLEYEETADLATSIAKLRSLLEQKSTGSSFSTPALSPMPMLESEDVDDTDGVMPSFYKFCAKTATGVFNNTLNTIKTALPSNPVDCDRYDGSEKWTFLEAHPSESDLLTRINKLLSERKVFCTVDTAYEALDSLDIDKNAKLAHNIQFEDELDDFEVKLPVAKTLFDIVCELLADSKDTSLTQEPVIKSVLLLFGNYMEDLIVTEANDFMQNSQPSLNSIGVNKSQTLSLELDVFVDAVLSGVPDYVKLLIGEKTLREAATLLISSLQVEQFNQDMVLQIFEIISLKFLEGSKQCSLK